MPHFNGYDIYVCIMILSWFFWRDNELCSVEFIISFLIEVNIYVSLGKANDAV